MSLKQSGIYILIIQSPDKTYKYVGQSKNISGRIYQHKSSLKNNRHYNTYLQRIYNKHCNSTKDILVKYINYKLEYLNVMEQTWINITQCESCVCLNNKPGKAQRGYTLTQEHKTNISTSLKASPKAQASVKRMNELRIENYTGKTEKQLEASRNSVKYMNTPEAIAKFSKTIKTSIKWKEARKKVGKLNIGNQYALGKTRGLDNANADTALYVFQHKKSKEIFVETRSDLRERIKKVKKNSVNPRLSNMISGKEKSAYGYVLLHCPLPK